MGMQLCTFSPPFNKWFRPRNSFYQFEMITAALSRLTVTYFESFCQFGDSCCWNDRRLYEGFWYFWNWSWIEMRIPFFILSVIIHFEKFFLETPRPTSASTASKAVMDFLHLAQQLGLLGLNSEISQASGGFQSVYSFYYGFRGRG